jgi:heptosyltransferase-2
MSSFRGKILVIRGGAIGDFILTLPALAALRRQFPEAGLEVLGYPHIVQLAVAGGLADRVQSIEARALAGFFARGGKLAEDLADYFSEFDVIISYLYDPDGIFRANVGFCTQAQFIAGPHRPDENANIHATNVFLAPLERLAIFDADPVPRLELKIEGSEPEFEAHRVSVGQGGGAGVPWIALHPGSGSERKNWPEANWAKLADAILRESSCNILLVGGEAEGDRLERLAARLPAERIALARSLPLVELAHRLRSCAGFVGHDSGISHLAAALGLRGLVLWGDTVEAVWRPAGDHLTVLRHRDGIAGIEPEVVLAQFARIWQDA